MLGAQVWMSPRCPSSQCLWTPGPWVNQPKRSRYTSPESDRLHRIPHLLANWLSFPGASEGRSVHKFFTSGEGAMGTELRELEVWVGHAPIASIGYSDVWVPE